MIRRRRTTRRRRPATAGTARTPARGAWTFDKVDSVPDAGHCNGFAEVTVAGKAINVDVTTSGCDGVGVTFYGKKPSRPSPTATSFSIRASPRTRGRRNFLLQALNKKDNCASSSTGRSGDNHDPTQVAANFQIRSEEQFKDEWCAGAGYSFDFQAEIPKKDD
jgi:hypothetical protein